MNTTLDLERDKLETLEREVRAANVALSRFGKDWRRAGCGSIDTDAYSELKRTLAAAESKFKNQCAVVRQLHTQHSESVCAKKKGEARGLAQSVAEAAASLDAALGKCHSFVNDLEGEGVSLVGPALGVRVLTQHTGAAFSVSAAARRVLR